MSGSANLYLEYLSGEGYRPSLDADGDVSFKSEGRSYFIDIDEGDPTYFQLVYPNFWQISDPDERHRAMAAAGKATRGTKVVKVYVRDDGADCWAAAEIFLAKTEDFAAIFDRSLRAIRTAVNTFREEMQKPQANGA